MAGPDWSQHGESTLLAAIFARVGTATRHAVEFGAGDGWHNSNIRMFLEDGWTGVQWDTETWVTAENVNDLFAEHRVPADLDLLSVDIDGNDYWVWRALRWRPRVVVIEYNAWFGHGERVSLAYDPAHRWAENAGYGASLDAMCDLGESKGYTLVGEVAHANLVFARSELGLAAQRREQVQLGWDGWARLGGLDGFVAV